VRTQLPEGGFAYLPHNPGATGITQVSVSDSTDDAGNLSVSFGDGNGIAFALFMPPSQWRLVCDTLIASHHHIRWNVGSLV